MDELVSKNFIENFIDEDLAEGGRCEGMQVHTRFPPEPNGYLHIGHCKALIIDFGTAEKYNGICNLRMDDTNPAKEDTEYVDAIQEDIHWLGFDWDDRRDVWNKVKEEILEFEAEVENMDRDKATREFGDIMFSLINAARLYHINPDTALEHTNQKFISRFNYVEQKAREQGRAIKDLTLAEMDALWNEAKESGNK